MLFYDMGATGTKATVVQFLPRPAGADGRPGATAGAVRVLGVAWDAELGGALFTERVAQLLLRTADRRAARDQRALARLRQAANKAKEVRTRASAAAAAFAARFRRPARRQFAAVSGVSQRPAGNAWHPCARGRRPVGGAGGGGVRVGRAGGRTRGRARAGGWGTGGAAGRARPGVIWGATGVMAVGGVTGDDLRAGGRRGVFALPAGRGGG